MSRGLPEDFNYRDDGCDIHPHCLSCPLPVCRYDAGSLRKAVNIERDRAIAEAWDAGRPAPEIMRAFGISRRTLFRALERHKMAHQTRQDDRETASGRRASIPHYTPRASGLSAIGVYK